MRSSHCELFTIDANKRNVNTLATPFTCFHCLQQSELLRMADASLCSLKECGFYDWLEEWIVWKNTSREWKHFEFMKNDYSHKTMKYSSFRSKLVWLQSVKIGSFIHCYFTLYTLSCLNSVNVLATSVMNGNEQFEAPPPQMYLNMTIKCIFQCIFNYLGNVQLRLTTPTQLIHSSFLRVW